MRNGNLLRVWLPTVLFVGSIVLAFSTPINPWIIGACAGSLVVVALVADRLLRRRGRRDGASVDVNR